MNLAVLSGKGGAGKTTVAVNLAVLLGADYFDCDVEEPNGFLFLKPKITESSDVFVQSPKVDVRKCALCGRCAAICQFGALANTKKEIIVFPEMCHSCRACEIVCDQGAITYYDRHIGVIEKGAASGISCARGVLNVGEYMAVPLIRRLLTLPDPARNSILDTSPGTSCNVVNTLHRADAALVVAEPTVFGVHDMEIAVKLAKSMRVPFHVVINKSRGEDDALLRVCDANETKVLGSIPFSRHAAEAYSEGQMLVDIPEFRGPYEDLATRVKEALPWNW